MSAVSRQGLQAVDLRVDEGLKRHGSHLFVVRVDRRAPALLVHRERPVIGVPDCRAGVKGCGA